MEPEGSVLKRGLVPPPAQVDIDREKTRSTVGARLFGLKPAAIKIGRFTVLDRVGAGAMGVVYAAYDDQLDRKVAVKVLHPETWGSDQKDARDRLLREAQALAKLSHPNVVAVHEVGVHQDQLYIALEFIDGMTLRAWLEERKRSWPEIKAKMLEAGQGLAAAHAAGLVHRDFKPDNVLVDRAGRVRVVDFGLARAQAGQARPASLPTGDGVPNAPQSSMETARFAGTPAYMSPEQIRGQSVTEKTDQFAFCITLYEALYGERPFQSATPADLAARIADGFIVHVPAQPKVPAWLRDAILRGLANEPSKRFPSMSALLSAIERSPWARRRRWVVAAVAVVCTVVFFSLGWLGRDRSQTACGSGRDRFESVWNPAVREVVRARFVSSGLPYGADAFETVSSIFDVYKRNWVSSWTGVCESTFVKGEHNEDYFALSSGCLDGKLERVRALVHLFAEEADRDVIVKAVDAATNLEDLRGCKDESALFATTPTPRNEQARAEIERLDKRLMRAEALESAGKFAEGLNVAREVVDGAEKVAHPPLLAKALYRLGYLLDRNGKYQEAEQTLRRVLPVAADARDSSLVAKTWLQLMWITGYEQAHYDAALALRSPAEVAVRYAKGDPSLEGTLHNTLGALYGGMGKHEEAEAEYKKVLESWKTRYSPNDTIFAAIYNNLGGSARALSRYEEARDYFEKALAIYEKGMGLKHPQVGLVLDNLGLVLKSLGQYDRSEQCYRQALEIWRNALGPEHPDVGTALKNLGDILREQAKYPEARQVLDQALAIREKQLGPAHPKVAWVLNSMGLLLKHQGEYDEALAYYGRAFGIWEKALGKEHPDLAYALDNMGGAWTEVGDYDRAVSSYESAIGLWEKAFGKDSARVSWPVYGLGHVLWVQGKAQQAEGYLVKAFGLWDKTMGGGHPNVSYPLVDLGEIDLSRKDFVAARVKFERGLSICEKRPCAPGTLPSLRFGLARAQWELNDDRSAAVDLAREALQGFSELGKMRARRAREVTAWISGRAPLSNSVPNATKKAKKAAG